MRKPGYSPIYSLVPLRFDEHLTMGGPTQNQ